MHGEGKRKMFFEAEGEEEKKRVARKNKLFIIFEHKSDELFWKGIKSKEHLKTINYLKMEEN